MESLAILKRHCHDRLGLFRRRQPTDLDEALSFLYHYHWGLCPGLFFLAWLCNILESCGHCEVPKQPWENPGGYCASPRNGLVLCWSLFPRQYLLTHLTTLKPVTVTSARHNHSPTRALTSAVEWGGMGKHLPKGRETLFDKGTELDTRLTLWHQSSHLALEKRELLFPIMSNYSLKGSVCKILLLLHSQH